MIRVRVPLPDGAYEVVVGAGARRLLGELVAALPHVPEQVAVVTEDALGALGWFGDLDPGVRFEVCHLRGGERAKSLASVEALCRSFARLGLSRRDAVVAVGGGLVTDVAGFAASIYLRGIPYLNVATSLLAQVDAAVGGKTGANLVEGKNLVGTFWQPAGVLCDTDLLATLPERELRCGRGEMAKYAFLAGSAPDLSILELGLDEQVARCVGVKAAVVAADEREGGRRAVLNYGHTLAHALEAALLERPAPADGGLRHGEAVAVGLLFAALLARRLGRIDDARVAQHRGVLDAFGLSAELPAGLEPATLLEYMARDKKAHHDLTFVLDGPRGVEVVRGVGTDDVLATLKEMGGAR